MLPFPVREGLKAWMATTGITGVMLVAEGPGDAVTVVTVEGRDTRGPGAALLERAAAVARAQAGEA
jgi:hypothetical protein